MIECDENGFYEVEGREYQRGDGSGSGNGRSKQARIYDELEDKYGGDSGGKRRSLSNIMGITGDEKTPRENIAACLKVVFVLWAFVVVPMLALFAALNHLFATLGLNWRV
jgi:hypothetical protein